MHVQRMLKMSRIYTLTEIINNILVKNTENWGPYLRSWFDNLESVLDKSRVELRNWSRYGT